jgi:hypothetical protein
MKKALLLAYSVFVFGFVWICFCQFEIRAIGRGVMVTQSEKIPKQQSYKLEDVQTAIHGTVVDMADRIPMFPIGGLIMLGGSLVLDMTLRQKNAGSCSIAK